MPRKKIDPARIAAFQKSQEFTPDATEPSARSEGKRGPMRIMYIENKSEGLSGGEAHIGRVTFSKSGATLYYHGGRTEGQVFSKLSNAGSILTPLEV